MSNAVVKAQPQLMQLPANLQSIWGDTTGTEDDLSGGVISGFPTISYRGKVWRIRKGGEETNYVDDNGDAVQSIEVVLVKSHPKPSKIFYDKPFEEGDISAPRCWSANGETPDSGVKDPIAHSCAGCPNNVWGSKINQETGAKGRACADARRIAAITLADLSTKGTDATKCLLRVPPSSLNPLKDYAEKVLKPKGIPYFAVVTRIGFDTAVAYPKMTFRATRFLNEDEARAVLEIRDSDDVKHILNESTEFAGAAEAAGAQADAIQGHMPASMQTAAATAEPAQQPASSTMTAPTAAPTTATTPPRASSAVAAETFTETTAPAAPKPRGRPPGKKAEAAPTVAPVTAQATSAQSSSPPEAPSEFDALLDKLLSG